MKLSFDEVVQQLRVEREYQARRWGVRTRVGDFEEIPKTIGEYLVFIQHYLGKAVDAATISIHDEDVLEYVRKIAALSIACMEQNGIQARDMTLPIYNARDGKVANG